MDDGLTQNWNDIEQHMTSMMLRLPLDQLQSVLKPLAKRFYAGERIRALAEEIMVISL